MKLVEKISNKTRRVAMNMRANPFAFVSVLLIFYVEKICAFKNYSAE